MKRNKSTKRIIAFYLIIPIIVAIVLYNLLPTILNYPPNSIDNNFQSKIDGITYTTQFVLITIMCISVGILILINTYNKINKCNGNIAINNKDKQKWLDELTKICVSTPIKLYASQILIPLILTPIVIAMIGAETIVVFKISIIFILFFSLSATMSYVFSQREFQNIIISTYEEFGGYTNNIITFKPKIRIRSKILLELIPLIIIALIFTSLLAYTMNTRIIGDIYYKIYNEELNNEYKNRRYSNLKELKDSLDTTTNNDITKFIISEDENYVTSNNNTLSKFFIKYALDEKNDNRTYDYYCIDREGTFIKVKTLDGNVYLLGIMYNTSSNIFLMGLIVSCIVLFSIIFITLIYIASNLSKDIALINDSLKNILSKQDLTRNLIVTSNDETGELMDAYNRIQALTQENIKEINEKQELLIRQEKLSILGEMAGGMAHDINNPASAINMSINVLYNIDDREEKKKILDNMNECVKRILSIVSSVRDQFRNIGDTKKEKFVINEVLQNIEVVIHNQLNKYNCSLNVNYENNFKVYGEENKLNQVISNIVMNSILAYKDINSTGSIIIDKAEENEYNIIKVIDNAGGIPENIKDKLFTKILTTRGTQGTGLGLYLAKSIIEDEFKGKIYFETELGKGTTFYIKLKKVVE